MKTTLKYFIIIMISTIAASCDKGQDYPNNPDYTDEYDLVGKWVCQNISYGVDYTIMFKDDGSGWMEWSDEDYRSVFVYTVIDDKIYFRNDYDSWEYLYLIKGKTLTIYGNPWGEDDDVDILKFTRK